MTEQTELEEQGLADLEEGLDTLDAAADVAAVGEAALAEGVSDVTRGVDAMVVADRVAALSEIVAAAVPRDVEIEWYGDPDHRSYRVAFEKLESIGFKATRTVLSVRPSSSRPR